MSDVLKLVTWAKQNGDEMAVARIKIQTLSVLLAEKITLDKVDSTTKCSKECFEALKTAAAKIVGKPYPY